MKMKMFARMLVVLITVSFVATLSFAQSEEKKAEETVLCPVSGESILKSDAVGPYSYEGIDYYFCCNNCLEKFKADPKSYLNKVTTVCCEGKKIDKEKAIKVTYEGKDYYFCSEKYKEAFDKDPKAYIEKMQKAAGDKKCAHEHKKKCCKDK